MQITVIDVGTPNTHAGAGGRSYQSMEVTYKGVDGKVASKKLMSFSNPSIFNTAKTWSKGQEVNVITQKDDKGYWQWTGLDVTGESSVAESKPTAAGASTNTRTVGSNYETKEERAQRQVYIVRQSSISAAVAALTAGAKAPPSQEDILNLARTFEAHVFAVPSAIESLVEFDSDIPE